MAADKDGMLAYGESIYHCYTIHSVTPKLEDIWSILYLNILDINNMYTISP